MSTDTQAATSVEVMCGTSTPTSPGQGLLWTLALAVVWSVLVAWRPTTTWHLAPLILAAIATTLGLLRTVRRTTSASARLGTSQVAASDDIVTVEGNADDAGPQSD